MANRIGNLLGNTKTRTLVLLVVGLLIFGVVIAVSQTGPEVDKGSSERVSKTTTVPAQVESTPGAPVTPKYRELQEQANLKGATEAAQKGNTFIPTLTGKAQGFDNTDFDKQLSAAYDDLGGKCSKETVAKLRKDGMDTTHIILELKSYGCSSAAIASLFTRDEIAAALLAVQECEGATGCTDDDAKKLKAGGNDAKKIAAIFKKNGCTPTQTASGLKATGSNYTEIASAMKASGASYAEIATALKANGANIDEITSALKANGANASEIASALSKAGYSKLEIMPALAKAGFNATDIAKAIAGLDSEGVDPAALARQKEADRLAAQQEAQQLAAFSQQRQTKIQELMAAMEVQKKAAMDTWTNIPAQNMVIGEWEAKKAAAEQAAASGGNGAFGATAGSSKNASGDENPAVVLKAGSILFAVLDTAVNSDEPGPVMATIVSGSLKGSKLMGSMTTNTDSEKISLSFTAINMPNEKASMGIDAIAIDPDTARTALATDVDRHYLLRWGSLFASSFMQGYSSAVASSGQTSSTSIGAAGVTTTTTSPPLNGRQQLFEGLGAFGTKWSEVVAKNFDRPSTITIDQGTGIGILLNSDLQYGTDPIYYKAPTPGATTTAAAGAAGAAAVPGAAANNNLSPEQAAALIGSLQKQTNSTPVATNTTTTIGGK